jgi:hypothetical protein
MKRALFALTLLLGAVCSTANADYIVIVANLARQAALQGAAGPAPPGMRPGVMGAPGGIPGGQPGGQAGGGFGGGAPGGAAGAPTPGAPDGAFVPPPAEAFDPDKVPLMIVAVVELEKKLTNQDAVTLMLGYPIGGPRTPRKVPYKIAGQDGKLFFGNTSITRVGALHPNGKPPLPLHEVYDAKVKALKESKTVVTADQWVELAEWCLAHGMLEHFKEHMEAAVAIDKANTKAAAFLQMKAALAKPVTGADAAGHWREQLLSTRFQTKKSAHYALLTNDKPSADSRSQRLEEALQTYYYWFALHGVQLPLPTDPLVVILTSDPKGGEFKHLNSVLDSSPVVSDSFYAHRENITVLSSKRLDDAYDRLDKMAQPLWSQGYNKELLLTGQLPRSSFQQLNQETLEAMTFALLLKVMESDAAIAGTQNGATRQLIYASGLLPPNVAAPEWIQFGVSSFFETSPGSPWPTCGTPNFTYHPLFKGLKSARKLPEFQLDLLREVVTDGFFRNPADGLKKDAGLRRARATAWSLSYFLLRKRMDGLKRYFQELSQMPRDLTLDEQTLWLAFARAFNAVDASGQPDLAVLRDLADDWDKDVSLEQYDTREMDLMREIRKAYEAAAQQGSTPPPGNQAIAPPGTPPAFPGGRRPGG